MLIANLANYDKTRVEKKGESNNLNGLKYAVSSMQGWRYEMEDAHCAKSLDKLPNGWTFFGVFDGHGGSYISEEASKRLADELNENLGRKFAIKNDLSLRETIEIIRESFLSLDSKLAKLDKIVKDEDKSGTTVVGALITPKHIFLINCGDSRAILVRNGEVELNTFDHKPTQLKERQRIQNANGIVALSRVNGGLATSRGIGDFEYKNVPNLHPEQQFVSPEPDIDFIERDFINDQFIVLACDGIWDVMDNNAVNEYFSNRIRDLDADLDTLKRASDDLLDRCLEKGSRDNMSVIMVLLPKADQIGSLNHENISEIKPSSRKNSAMSEKKSPFFF